MAECELIHAELLRWSEAAASGVRNPIWGMDPRGGWVSEQDSKKWLVEEVERICQGLQVEIKMSTEQGINNIWVS